MHAGQRAERVPRLRGLPSARQLMAQSRLTCCHPTGELHFSIHSRPLPVLGVNSQAVPGGVCRRRRKRHQISRGQALEPPLP